MVLVGFIKEIDLNIANAKSMEDMFLPDPNPVDDRAQIIAYLSKGLFLVGVMSRINDNDGQPIGSLDYFTDGEFIWPIYYKYYMEKYGNFYIDDELLAKARKNGCKITDVDKNTMQELEKYFIQNWTKKK